MEIGGKSSKEEVNTSLTSKTRRLLMSMEERISKVRRLLYGKDTMD
jgi:hypothetical protein